MKTLLTAIGLLVAGGASSSTPEPSTSQMAAAAYRVPAEHIDTAASAMQRHMLVSADEIPNAIGQLAACGKAGALEFRDLIVAMPELAQVWGTRVRNRDLERVFDIEAEGTLDVSRLCMALESARSGYKDSDETIKAMLDTLRSNSHAARVAKSMMISVNPVLIDGASLIRSDYQDRLRQS